MGSRLHGNNKMNQDQENFLSMVKTTQTTVNANAGAWSGVPLFVTHYANINSKVSALETARNLQLTNITGYSIDKGNKKAVMITATFKLINGLLPFAKDSGNVVLEKEADYSESDLKDYRDEDVAGVCQIVVDRANTNIAALAGVGIQPADVTDAQTKIGDYVLVSQMPSAMKDVREGATAAIPLIMTDIRTEFGILDPLVKNMDPVFKSTYFSSRETYDLTGGGAKPPIVP